MEVRGSNSRLAARGPRICADLISFVRAVRRGDGLKVARW